LKHFSFLGKKKQEYEYACASIKKRTRKEWVFQYGHIHFWVLKQTGPSLFM
jgi:hypothetical protein